MPCLILIQIFIVVPLVELAILIYLGQRMGIGATVGLVVITGAIGLVLARWQGTRVLKNMREDMAKGQVPAPHLLDGVMILLASAVLMTPGLITDLFGFLLLIPPFRKIVKGIIRRRIERSIKQGSMRIHVNHRNVNDANQTRPSTAGAKDKPLLDADYREIDE
jgi:UPF0716 protein FxsA